MTAMSCALLINLVAHMSLLSTEWVDYVEEPTFSLWVGGGWWGGWWCGCGWWWGGVRVRNVVGGEQRVGSV